MGYCPIQRHSKHANLLIRCTDIHFVIEEEAMYDARPIILLAYLFAFFLFPLHALAGVNCSTLPHWATLGNGLQMSQKHVFCGEWTNSRPKGFHSRPGGVNPATVRNFTVQDSPNSAGIYTGRWSHTNNPDRSKFSSMFPDSCSTEQVLNSISYASAHPDRSCPEGSPGWVKCGKNRPTHVTKEELSGYCSNNEEFFLIGFAAPGNNKINTAFPIRQ
ncbi:EndoU domain-containing protein [Nitrosospira multiformis]